jgi:anaerobic magnesium-protoporphyrin IX monomethyl ester cyclase
MEERPRVLFVLPPGGVTPWFAEHLGTAFLRAVLARAGIASEQLLPARNPSVGELARMIRERRPALVGVTAYESNLRACRALVRAVRLAAPEAVVAVGGPNATFSPEETLALTGADLCLRGAAEGTIAGIAGAILGAGSARRRLPDLLAPFANTVVRTAAGFWRSRAGDLSSFPAEHFATLDDVPSPYQDGVLRTADVGLLTARGCNQSCTYCSFAAVSGRKVHFHGVERVLEDLAAFKPLAETAGRRRPTIPICDDAFTLAPERARAICEGIVRRGLQLPFDCETRADRVDEELLRLMARAGFTAVSFGLESAVPRVLRAIGKVQDPRTRDDPAFEAERAYLEAFRGAVTAARRAGVDTAVSVIGGLPGETADDLRATLAFVESLGVPMYVHNVLTLYPGTPLYRDRARHGLDAGRDPISGSWRTRHAYDVQAVLPLATSLLHQQRWEEAEQIADALCGRPGDGDASDGGAWAIVVHGREPRADLVRWLRDALVVHGRVVVLGGEEPPDRGAWLGALAAEGVAFGGLTTLSRERARGGGAVLRTHGGLGDHRFDVQARWPRAPRAIRADADGGCAVPLWIASGADDPPHPRRRVGPFSRAPQIADGCRFWSGWRRCRDPRVLHVGPGKEVRPCWHGPSIGEVGDDYGALAARARALGGPHAGGDPRRDRCPLAGRSVEESGTGGAAERYEVAAKLAWLFHHADRAGGSRSGTEETR